MPSMPPALDVIIFGAGLIVILVGGFLGSAPAIFAGTLIGLTAVGLTATGRARRR